MRERTLRVVLLLLGLVFMAGIYPLIVFVRQEPALSMMMSLYVMLGLFLLLASRNPAANRSLIAFTTWSSLAHSAVMAFQASRNMIQHTELIGVAVFGVIGILLITLTPAKSVGQVSAAAHAHS